MRPDRRGDRGDDRRHRKGFLDPRRRAALRRGRVGSLLGSYDSSYAYPGTHLLEINGTDARIVVIDTVRRFALTPAGSEITTSWEAGYFNDTDRAFHRMFDAHLDAVIPALRAGGEPPIHARAGRRALALAYAVIESFESGRRVDTGAGTRWAV